ncbi:MAG: ATP-binding cassette domain-containing protein [Synergistaceae bacterium]|jgi:molybdate transport system ATP-binding protein|nr:ATP-binding cassette domain-containing protein [Synergistaceae bacterium]PKL05144.1 MAG: ABC transporter [Synergistetes bacterium HGW-Synergistetes-1]
MSIYVKIIKSFGNFVLNTEFEAGNEILALLGSSGSGKSMTLKCIAGIVKPDEGRIVVDGVTLFDSDKKINLSPQERHVGLLFQNYALFPNMTVEQNLYTVLKNCNGQKNTKERLDLLLESFYLTGLEKHYPGQLSGGQQQRVALARIMASDPKIIMLDEPLSALDSYLRWQVEKELTEILGKYKGSTLYVSHNRDEVYRLCKKVCVINKGHSEKVSSVNEFFNSPSTLASALLSGCKNYSKAEKLSHNTVHAFDWKVNLRCNTFIPDDTKYIGVRAHRILPFRMGDECQNKVICRVLEIRHDLFSVIITLTPQDADPKKEFSQIQMELPSIEDNFVLPGDIMAVNIPIDMIMPLRK